MKKYIFLLPLYNDWESLSMLLNKISDQMIYLKQNAEILVINDCSNVKAEKFGKYKNINKIQVLNLKKNLGSQKAISVGLNYLNKIHHKSIITVLDSDGEDDVHKIPIMIENAEKNDDKVIVSTRTTRQENLFFRLAYFMHKVLTLFFTLKWISYGNFSSFNSKQLKKILANNYSWLAISSCIAQNCNIIKIKAGRKKRLIGISKLSIMGLISHSLRVNAVFLYRAIILSTLYIFILLNLNFLTFQYLILFVIQILIFNFLLIITLLKNNQKEFYNFTDLINEIIEL